MKDNLVNELGDLVNDCISRQAAIDAFTYAVNDVGLLDAKDINVIFQMLPPLTQPETAKRIVGKSRGGITLWYQCDVCHEPVDAQDKFCRRCGRKLKNDK